MLDFIINDTVLVYVTVRWKHIGVHSLTVLACVLMHLTCPRTGDMEWVTAGPCPADKFAEHVRRLHANDNYYFSQEYEVGSSLNCISCTLTLVCGW